MSAGASGGAAAAAAHAAMIQASRAMGVIVSVVPDEFLNLLQYSEEPLIVHALTGFFSKSHQYLTSLRGLAFYTKSKEPLDLPAESILVESKSIWVPGT